MFVDLHQRQFIILLVQMARTKNVGGGPGDDDRRPPPRQPARSKGKSTKQVTSNKRKYPDAEIARAAAVAEAAKRAERGGARSGVVIADQPVSPAFRAALEEVERRHGSPAGTVMFAGRWVTIEEGPSAQQQPPQAEPQQTQEADETEPAPQLRRSGRTRVPVSPRPPTQRRGSRPPPRPQGPPRLEGRYRQAGSAAAFC